MVWLFKATPRPLYPQERNPVPIVQNAVWPPRPVQMGAENIALLRFDPRTVQPIQSLYTH